MGIMSKRNASRAKLTLCLIAVAITVGRWTGCASQVTSHVQLKLGAMYATGNGVPQDDQEAAKWYRKAAEQGHAGAQFLLGTMYVTGKGVPQDDREAAKWYGNAAEQGLAEAQYGLGAMYDFGKGVPQDHQEAVRWYRKAAEQGDADAQFLLGGMYATGKGVPQDHQEAVRWYRKAAEQGNAAAQNHLSLMHHNSVGVPQDVHDWFKRYRKAAEQGDAEAQNSLGMMYASGTGVPQDDREAAKWTRKAAAQGLAEAQYGLGYMYAKGEGVLQDFLQAHAWMNLAAGQGYKRAAEHRDRVATRMTPAQVFEAQQLAAELRDRIDADINGRGRELTGTMPQPRHAAEPQAQSTNRISEYGVVTDPREARDTEPGEWDGAYRVGSGVTPPTVLSRIEPVYSEAARKAKLQGKVVLSAIVRKDGSLEVLSVVRGLGLGLDENAIKALKKWRFRPGKRSGKPVDVALNIEVDFSLRSRF